ncbi:MAG: M16 family metallopeptidase [Flammeovirgaceae bacterium]
MLKPVRFYLMMLLPLLWSGLANAQTDLEAEIPVDQKVRIGKLDNGLTYYIRKNAKPEKRAELRLAVNAGSLQEDDQQLGLAHFTEHMAFNGTKNFKKNDLISYLQSIGVKFGAHLNAYTSFDETVYMLSLPTDDEEILDKGMQVLEDWAHNVSFEDEEIDKERGVVVEEWRLGQGANRRMLDKNLPVIYKGSRYAKRLPIGTKEILENFEYETIKRFYKDWYRPDLMAVVVVGDVDVDQIEKMIKEKFGRIQKATNPKERVPYQVPDHDETLVTIAKDKEAAFTRVSVYYKTDVEKTTKVKDYRQGIVNSLFSGMLNNRLDELRQSAEPPFIFAGSYYGGTWARTKNAYQMFATVSENGVAKGLQAVLEENERVRRHGFTKGELERYKKEILVAYERAYNERDKTNSRNYASEYVSNFLEGEPMPGIEFEYNFLKETLPSIKLEEVNALINKWLTEKNRVIAVTGIDRDDVKLPTKADLLKIVDGVTKADIKAYEDGLTATELMTKKPAAGKITEEKKVDAIGVTELTLSNGVRVILKPTDFKNDQIMFSAVSPGGHSLVEDKDYYSASNASGIISQSGVGEFNQVDMQKLMTGKSVRVSPYIGSLSEGMSGVCTPKDMETMMQQIHLYFTAPRKDEKAFQSMMVKNKALFKNLMSNPQFYFSDQRTKIIGQGHLRAGGFPTMEQMEQVDLDVAYQVYKDRFADASDFMFTIVGAFNVAEIKPLLTQYIASLPATNRNEKWIDRGVRPPKGVVTKEIEKGTDPKSSVYMRYHGEMKYDRKTAFQMKVLSDVLTIKLVEKLREEKGGVYGTGASAFASKDPYGSYQMSISFSCAPDNVQELIDAAKQEVEMVRKKGPTQKDLDKVKETLKREMEVSMESNRYWMSSLQRAYYDGYDATKILEYKKTIDELEVKKLKKIAKKYFGGKNYIQIVMNPEEEKM